MRLLTPPGVLRPPSDSWLLARVLRKHAPGASVLDVGTGSGILAVAAACGGARHVTAVDVSRRALLTARINARLNGVRIEALRGDLFAPVAGRRFDVIVSNPPYVPGPVAARGVARAWAAGRDGRALLDRVLSGAPGHLAPGGRLLVVHSSLVSVERSLAQLRQAGLDAVVAARSPGPLGPLMRAAFPGHTTEELVVVHAGAG